MKKSICLILFCALLLQLCACGAPAAQESAAVTPVPETEPSSADSAIEEEPELEWVLRSEELCPFGYEQPVTAMAALGNTLLLSGTDKESRAELGLADYTINEDGSVSLSPLRPLALSDPEAADQALIYELAADADSFYVLCGEPPRSWYNGHEMQENSDYAGRMRLLRYSPEGELLAELPLQFAEGDAPGILAVQNAEAIALVGNNSVLLCGMEAGLKNTLELPKEGSALSVQRCGKGVVVSFMSWRSMGCSYYLVDFEEGALTELSLTQPEDPNQVLLGGSICQGLNGEYLLESGNRFHQLDFDADSTTELMQWSYAQMSLCQHALRLAEQSFLVQQQGSDSLLAVRRIAQPKRDRSTVRVAVYNAGGAADLVREQDNLSEQYHYEITEYAGAELDKLLVTMGTQDCPDLLLFCNDLNYGAISTASAAYADLYPFLDADPELSRDSFLPNLLKYLEVGGELHEMWTQTGVTSLIIRPEDLGGRTTALTPADLDEILAGTDYEAMFETFMDYENLLKFVAEVGMSRYVDRSDGSCHFDDPSFVELIRWCGEMGAPVPEGSDYPYLRYDQVLLGLGGIQSADLSFLGTAPPRVYIGFPTGDGRGSYYAQNYMAPVMAIPAASRNKEGAWAFIRSQLTESAQRKVEYGLPVNLKVVMAQAEATGTPEAVQQFSDLLNSVGFAENNSDNQLRQIILENGLLYCQGSKSLDETIKLIQSKASLYLAEHYN